ncbi:hypothetical protein ABZ756_06510 [Mammaliicoccus sciuri]|uniref:hypothetical protein n=1 Tax=Sporosarcina aquimarina TaxID=114975 RepID=UPI001C8F0F54|nr:hypothetical protein [Sporosarcina aquimarina]MBY0222154.1 hypothetical protein [Sporosarcina aquimarina]
MTHQDRTKIKIDKDKEMRTKEISKMISEGGLGAEKYYDIKKKSSATEKEREASEKPEKSKEDH